MKMRWVGLTWIGIMAATPVLGQGLLISRSDSSPLAMKSQHVETKIRDQIAVTHVTQVFLNASARVLEADFVFPLPRGANFTEFAMMMNGERVKGEVMPATRARAVYESIVAKARDPGLIEYIGNDLFRARVFPIPANGEQKIEISYSEVIKADAGLLPYHYPFRTTRGIRKAPDTSIVVDIRSKRPIKSVLAPTHKALISRPDDQTARVSFETTRPAELHDFFLYYTTGEEQFAANVVAHRKQGDDGYFLLLLSPSVSMPEEAIQPKDVCFVLDSSGSMRGDKLKQAKEALYQCIGGLNKDDRFAVLHFNTDVHSQQNSVPTRDGLALEEALARGAGVAGARVVPALKIAFHAAGESAGDAVTPFIDRISARGATALAGALELALRARPKGDRPYHVFFLTDGKPTVGVTDPTMILAMLDDAKVAKTRVFVFGVGYDVNARLLDSIADRTRGFSSYVHPDENIAAKVTALSRRVGAPLLTDIGLAVSGAGVRELYPKRVPDLYLGSQVEVFGRYTGSGPGEVILTADLAGGRREIRCEVDFPEKAKHDFVPALWARRKVGYLIENVRAHGAAQELVDEIAALGKEYGIVTPYTSLIALEPGDRARVLKLNPASSISFSFPDIDSSRIERVIDQNGRVMAAAGKMGVGGAGRGGWPDGMKDTKIRFIRLEYKGEGWDDGMDAVSRADINFLKKFRSLTGFNCATRGESHPIRLLKKYPKGYAPPFVFMTGHAGIAVSGRDIRILREYLYGGGMLFADCGSRSWDRAFRNFIARLLPGHRLQTIADDDILFQIPFGFQNGPPPLWHHGGRDAMGVKLNGRWAVFYHPGDVNDAWKDGRSGMSEELAEGAMEIGVNVLYYAFCHYFEMTRKYRGGGAARPAASAGEQAVRASEATAARKNQITLETSPLRRASDRIFAKTGSTWVDQAWTGKPKPSRIRFGSDAFFDLLKRRPDLKEALSLGEDVLIVLDADTVLHVGTGDKVESGE